MLREIFPIESYDKKLSLSYLRYELGKPRYEPDECRQLRLTYGRPFRIWLRLNKEQPIEEEVYLGDLPIMLGGGEFIINGAERVVVSQLHRSPGIDFVSEIEAGERRLFSCRVIPERGSWIEINTTKKDSITVRIDQSGKFSVMTLLRAMDPKFGLDADILRTFYETTKQKITDCRSAAKIEGKVAVGDVVYPVGSDRAGEIIIENGQKITKTAAETIKDSGLKMVEIMDAAGDVVAAQRADGRRHLEPRGSLAANLPAPAAGQPAAVGKGQGPVPREVLRHESLSPRSRRPLPDQSQAQSHRARR